ncbi:hypothetical protein SOVF_086410 isoform A [Spinacia oleracea]|nr:hypothetical protein SOVF_086410 isoform A [Spinacia oleracea]
MLPGVEAARRRRVHQSSNTTTSSSSSPSFRRSSFSLFSSNSSASLLGETRSRMAYEEDENWKLGVLAREAKVRLDHKLRAPTLINPTRNNSNSDQLSERSDGGLRREVLGRRKKKSLLVIKKLGWNWNWNWNWKSGEQQECAVCLDEFKLGQNVINLACAHRFHSNCVLPWLNTNAHCPCCRLSIL